MKHFSERENKIIKIIGRKKMTLEQIGKKLFEEGYAPFDSTISVANSVNRIIKKCLYYELDWTLTKIRDNKKLTIMKCKIQE